MNRLRRVLAGTAAGAVAASGLSVLGVIAAPSASAESVTIDNAEFRWGVNNEANNGAYFGFNLMSAGKIGNPGEGGQQLNTTSEGATWANGEPAGWTNTDGNVTIEDLQADDTYAPTTFQGTRQNKNGEAVTVFNANFAETQAVFRNGTGSVDAETGTASIAWDGDLTVMFYTGMTFFYLSDPELTVAADGTGEVTATLGGYGSSMDDMTQWVALDDTEVTVATLEDVEVGATGIEVTPEYLGVEYEAPEGATEQARTGDAWGSFPQDFVDFQQLSGQSSYWYSSGSSLDPNKVAAPMEFSYTEAAPEPVADGQVVVSETTLLADGSHEVTVTGTGFTPEAIAPPSYLPIGSGGVYVAFGKLAETWKPTEDAPSANRKNSSVRWAVLEEDVATVGGEARGAIVLQPDGSFETTLTVDKAAIDAAVADSENAGDLTDYAVFTYAGGGAKVAGTETATPISFLEASTVSATSAAGTYGKATPVAVTVGGEGEAPSGTVALLDGAKELATAPVVDGTATVRLPAATAAGRHDLTVAYGGDDAYAASESAVAVSIAKKKAKAVAKVAKRPTAKRAGRLVVRVTKGATGVAAVAVKKGKRTVAKGQGRVNRAGVRTFRLPKRAAGRYRVVVAYRGDANHTGARDTARFRITPAKRR